MEELEGLMESIKPLLEVGGYVQDEDRKID
jgi:hypothetical protein